MAEITTFAAAPGLPLLAQVDGASYHELRIVVRRDESGSRPYCLMADWPTSWPARIADYATLTASLQQQIELLAERCEQLERAQSPAPAPEPTSHTTPATLEEPTPSAPAAPAPAGAMWRCHTCGREFASAKALDMHFNRTHAGMGRQRRAVDVDEGPAFVCAQCRGMAHARSVSDPDRCVKCVGRG